MSSQALVLTARTVPCRLLHTTAGRMRLYIDRLSYDSAYAATLLSLVKLLEEVTEVRINSAARSLIVHYPVHLPVQQVFDQVRTTIQTAATVSLSQAPITAKSVDWANLRGVGWMLLATGCFAGMQASIQFVSSAIHPFQIAFFSHLIGAVLLAPWISPAVLQTEQFPLHLLRAAIDTGATLLMFTSLSLIPLAQANAIGFTAPLFALLGAIIFLGEQAQPHTWIALLLGAVGMLLILRPGFEIISLGTLLMLAGSATLGSVLLIIKLLSKTDSALTINAYTVLLLTPLLLGPALLVWQTPTIIDLICLGFVAALMVGGHLAMTQAFVEADMTTVLPVEFVQLLWASGLGLLLFSETPEPWIFVGGLLIFSGSVYAASQEHCLATAA